MTARVSLWLACAVAMTAMATSCIGEIQQTDPADQMLLAPPRVGFEKVADAMQPSCGTLDCHGQVGRNLRLYGARGLRLSTTETSADGVTEPPEYDATFAAVLALEPEILSTVVRQGGAAPERLTLVRKGRGTERHKGGALMTPNDNLDRCIVEWVKGNIPVDACQAAAMITAPGWVTP